MLARPDPPPPAGPDDYGHKRLGGPGASPPKIEIVTASSLAKSSVPNRRWLVRDMIPDRTVSLITGDGGVGKSLLCLQLAVATASGTGWIGAVPDPGDVLYVSAEDDLDELHRRLAQICTTTGVPLDALDGLHIWPLAGEDAVLALPALRTELITPTSLFSALDQKVAELGPRLLVIDNLADAFGGNENSRPQARQFVGLLRGLAIRHRLAVLLIAHPSISGITSGSGTSGSTAWSNSVRSRLYLDRPKAEDGSDIDPDLRVLRTMKANYAATGTALTIRWESGHFLVEGTGPGMFDRIAAENRAEEVFLRLLGHFAAQDREVSHKPSRTYAPTVFAEHPAAEGITSKAFTKAMNRLFAADKIKVERFGPPSKERSKIVVAA